MEPLLHPGWTLAEALEATVPQSIRAAKADAQIALQMLGGLWAPVAWMSEELDGYAAAAHNRSMREKAAKRSEAMFAISQVEQALLQSLINGRLRAHGRHPTALDESRPIPASAWREFNRLNVERSSASDGKSHKIWDIVIYPVPDSPERGLATELTSVAAEQKCRRLLVSEMQKSPTVKVDTKSIWQDRVLAQINGLSRRSFLRAWDAAIDEAGAQAWKNPGAPVKRKPDLNSD